MKQSRAWTDDLAAPSSFGHSLEDLDAEDWYLQLTRPEQAVKCKERKHTKIVGDKKITAIKRIFQMKNGSVETIEDTLIEKITH